MALSAALATGASSLALHHGQCEVFNDPSRFRVVVAGRRWGKTQLAKTSLLSAAAKPKQLVWYVAPTYRMARTIMWDELLDSIPRAWIRSSHETRMEIELVNGSKIELKGADKPYTLRGVGIHHLVIDESQDIKIETWNKVLRPTLASTRGRAIIIGTPKGFNWFYDLYMRGQDEKLRRRGTWHSWQFRTIDSPFIPISEIDAARSDMDEKSFRQEFEASFETMSGRVYHAFNRGLHLGNYSFDPNLPIWVGQDFNIDPMSSVIMQPQPSGEIWAVDEVVLFGSSSEEVGEELGRRFWRYQKNLTVYPDPAGANRSHARGESDLDILRDAGFKRLKYRRKHPKVSDRVNAVNRMFKAADGSIRFRVDRKCKHTIEALEQTIYKKGTREVDKSLGVEHAADALGYAIELEFPVRDVKILGVSI